MDHLVKQDNWSASVQFELQRVVQIYSLNTFKYLLSQPTMERYSGKNYTMPAYCYSLLTDTEIVSIGIIIRHVYTSILTVDNNTFLDGGNNLYAVKVLVITS